MKLRKQKQRYFVAQLAREKIITRKEARKLLLKKH